MTPPRRQEIVIGLDAGKSPRWACVATCDGEGARGQARRQHAPRTAPQRVIQPRTSHPSKPKIQLSPKPKRGAHRRQPIRPSIQSNGIAAEQRPPSALVSLEQVARVHLVGHTGQIVAPAVGHERVAPGLELGQIMRDLAAEELRRVERRLVDHHGHALGLDALHDARIELSRKLSLFDFMVGRYTPTTGFFLPS